MAYPIILPQESGFHSKIIAIEFDGVCVANRFPKIGEDIGAAPILRRLVATGHRLILNTVRSDIERFEDEGSEPVKAGRKYLTEAMDWFKEQGIELYSVNCNPLQCSWSYSPKVHADLYIDQNCLGIPTRGLQDVSEQKRYVDWPRLEAWLSKWKYFENSVN